MKYFVCNFSNVNFQVIQADEAQSRTEDPGAHVQGVRQGADAACLLPGARDCHLRKLSVLCGEITG